MDLKRALGLGIADLPEHREQLRRYLNLKLTALGLSVPPRPQDVEFLEVARDLLANYRQQQRLLADHLNPVDGRIQAFLDAYAAGLPEDQQPQLPTRTLTLDHHGLARELSLPADGDEYHTPDIDSYRVRQGVLHNPRHDRRTTKGVFHLADGSLPVPADKPEVPRHVWAALLCHALAPPPESLLLPYLHDAPGPARAWISLLLRPTVVPQIPGRQPRQSMELRFLAPGSLTANLDFVESIFGNAGDPYLPENDAALDVDHWTGTTGCVVLATHLLGLRKKDLGLPHIKDASERQRRDGMCWSRQDELYNDGQPYKLCARSADGVIVTLIADNYFGYCKKEVKTQISFSANLVGLAEEEHAGGALAFATSHLGDSYQVDGRVPVGDHSYADVLERYAGMLDVQEEGYALDRTHPGVYYIPEDTRFAIEDGSLSWAHNGQRQSLPLLRGQDYIYPSGYRMRFERHPNAASWRLVGTRPEGTMCHKPCTVSGGGKSEISKSLSDTMLFAPLYVPDFRRDMDRAEALLERDYGDRLLPHLRPDYGAAPTRPVLSTLRTLGSVIKLFTPSPEEFTPQYSAWLETVPNHIKALVFIIKRFYRPDWDGDWRSHFSVDVVNGRQGNELRFEGRKLMSGYLRVGVDHSGSWQIHKVRQDFLPAFKLQMEDDITAAVVVPRTWLANHPADITAPSAKLVENCEYRLFQRPDDAIHRGLDHQAEKDLAAADIFASNFAALNTDDACQFVQQEVSFSAWTEPMQRVIRETSTAGRAWVVSSAHARIVDGERSKNPRYLQTRSDLIDDRDAYVATTSARLWRKVPLDEPVLFPVQAVLTGRRNNPGDRDAGIRPLAVYGPIHYQELPELFMDFVCSLTGKSPSTTGTGSEGALTKGPFNALRATADLNANLLAMILCGFDGFSTAAGWIGPRHRVEHDISLLIPELWCRMGAAERDPAQLIEAGYLERVPDLVHEGRTVLASRLGYRITETFVHTYLGRIFDHPDAVFAETMLRPELQDREDYIDGVDNIVEAQQRVAQTYFDDGSIDEACPPLRALLEVMAHGHADGRGIDDPGLRAMFLRDTVVASDWYQQRLRVKQQRDTELWERHARAIDAFLRRPGHEAEAQRLGLPARRLRAAQVLDQVRTADYLQDLVGTVGADPLGAAGATAVPAAR